MTDQEICLHLSLAQQEIRAVVEHAPVSAGRVAGRGSAAEESGTADPNAAKKRTQTH